MKERIAIWLGGLYPSGGSIVITVIEHIMLKNMWEYYVLKEPGYPLGDDVQWVFAMGFENEYGTFSRSEMREADAVWHQTRDMSGMAPPEGFRWLDEAVEWGDVDDHTAKKLIEREQDRHNPVMAWVKENHEVIDAHILNQVPNAEIDKDERYNWVWNDETLYNMAVSDGVSFD